LVADDKVVRHGTRGDCKSGGVGLRKSSGLGLCRAKVNVTSLVIRLNRSRER
jgi:hypothetical protein